MDDLLVWDGGSPGKQIPRKLRYVKSIVPIEHALYEADLVPKEDFDQLGLGTSS